MTETHRSTIQSVHILHYVGCSGLVADSISFWIQEIAGLILTQVPQTGSAIVSNQAWREKDLPVNITDTEFQFNLTEINTASSPVKNDCVK